MHGAIGLHLGIGELGAAQDIAYGLRFNRIGIAEFHQCATGKINAQVQPLHGECGDRSDDQKNRYGSGRFALTEKVDMRRFLEKFHDGMTRIR